MELTSPVMVNGGRIPKEYTGEGDDISPPLQIKNIPPETKSLVLIVDDPDAPSGIFTHWIVFDIDPNARTFERGKVPETSRLGKNDFGRLEYGGPKPPSGEHRYFFNVYALDTVLGIPEGAEREKIEKAMNGHVIDRTKFMGRYARTH